MAHMKNWQPPMTREERDWFDRCPKAVLFEIARHIGARLTEDASVEAAFSVMRDEWEVLHLNSIVPQKPPRRHAA